MKYFLSFLLFSSINILFAQNGLVNEGRINNEYNNKYVRSIKQFEGTIPEDEYDKLVIAMGKELNSKLSSDKSILIHYRQKATNCIQFGNNPRLMPLDVRDMLKQRNRLLRKYNTESYIVYNTDSFFAVPFEKHSDIIKDSGLFKQRIFELNDNCSAFFILKPSREFKIYYGEDYLSVILDFLELE